MATKAAYQKKLEAQLREWDAKLDQMGAKARVAAADARIGYENELESLNSKRAAAQKTLEELGKRGENAWEDLKDGAEKVWDEMGKATEKVAAPFKLTSRPFLRPPPFRDGADWRDPQVGSANGMVERLCEPRLPAGRQLARGFPIPPQGRILA